MLDSVAPVLGDVFEQFGNRECPDSPVGRAGDRHFHIFGNSGEFAPEKWVEIHVTTGLKFARAPRESLSDDFFVVE